MPRRSSRNTSRTAFLEEVRDENDVVEETEETEDLNNIDTWPAPKLKLELARRGLTKSGRRAILLKRLQDDIKADADFIDDTDEAATLGTPPLRDDASELLAKLQSNPALLTGLQALLASTGEVLY